MINFPNAKINLGLHIVEKRADGFHNLESFFYPVMWQDVLELVEAKAWQFATSGIAIPPDGKDNLCGRAYQLLQTDFDLPPVHIHLHKGIPIGAGLGGGSADAAFTLKALNQLFQLKLTTSQLADYARTLGSDCAFFIANQAQYCFEKGDKFEDLAIDIRGNYIGLVYPNLAISTQEAYRRVVPNNSRVPLRKLLLENDVNDWKNLIFNDFEQALFPSYPILGEVKQKLYDLGAIYAAMSGSGSTLFGIFAQKPQLKNHFPSEFSIWEGEL
ncbi:MAG: 4-(cytidine 5'-diphospho)-2-C-methyl-D-erythritol kinase [Microscillaceae bacterium]|jgi:4-diphosphocytidyl-2-C-methyl-D-erythritol kinase|nr:4-(cytidine 5'-diphospho)-2-C-methyl-D-erythritol kinase [Microscillaceae bacterium]